MEKNDKNTSFEIIYPKTEKPEEFVKQVDKYKETFNKYLEKIQNEQKEEEPS